MHATQATKAEFEKVFGDGEKGRLHVIRAPGRVNLIGEHTDYNDGLVFPMAIEPQVLIACRARGDGRVRLASTAFPGQVVEFSVEQTIERGEPAWANYFRGVAAELEGAGETVLDIGRIEAGQRGCTVVGDDNWDSHAEWSATHNA